MLPTYGWLILGFVAGVLSVVLFLRAQRQFRKRSGRTVVDGSKSSIDRAERSGDWSMTREKGDDLVRAISVSTDQLASVAMKVGSFLQEGRDDREALLRLVDHRSQEILQLLGQAVYQLEAEARLWRDLRPIIGDAIISATTPKQRTAEMPAPAVVVQTGRNLATLGEESRPRISGSLTDVISANFARIDLETGRRFEEFRKSFMDLLGTRVIDVREEDGAVLFLDGKTTGLLWPWPNNTLQKRWRDFFNAPKGENAPIKAVERPAVVTCQGDQWTLRTKGAVRQ